MLHLLELVSEIYMY